MIPACCRPCLTRCRTVQKYVKKRQTVVHGPTIRGRLPHWFTPWAIRIVAWQWLVETLCRVWPAPAALPLLLAAVKSSNQQQRQQAVQVLSKYRDPQVVDVLIGLLFDKDSDMRYAALDSLKSVIGTPELPRLLPFLTILPTSADRAHLVSILGAAGGAAVQPLAELTQDESPEIRGQPCSRSP